MGVIDLGPFMFSKIQVGSQKGYSLLRRVAILRKGRRFVHQLNTSIKDSRQKRMLKQQQEQFSVDQLSNMQDAAFRFVEHLQVRGQPAGRYYYSTQGTTAIIYASVYSALLFDLLNRIDDLDVNDRHEWIDYLNSFQCEDGLYRDPVLENDIAESIDWWGWRHLSAHLVSAVTALGGKTRYPFHFLRFLYGPGNAYRWINGLPWREDCANVSNSVMNYGVLLQYERDYWHNEQAGAALIEFFDFLEENINAETGLWYWSRLTNPQELSDAVQTSYHLWNLYFYEQRKIPYIERSIDSCLATQNTLGGFGATYNSSACEDIDSIDPLCRFYFLTDYRHADIERCLKKALPWVAVNQMSDGGFVFRRFASFKYGHELMETGPEQSHLFATWFRMLSIAYMAQVLDIPVSPALLKSKVYCPGYQFWND